jgi:beta-glucosidase
MVEGLQGDDLSAPDSMAACAKHYVGYGAAEAGVDYHKAEISDQTLRNYYLPAFRAAVDAGCQTVMNAFNDISGHPMASNRYLMTDVLRGEMGFDGFVVSDDWAVWQLERHGVAEDRKDCARLALNAGVDMDMRDNVYIENMEKCVEEGTVSMEVLDEAVRRILRVKFRLGLFDRPYTEYRPIDYAEHDKISRSLADECVTLLKNNGVLPLAKDAEFTVFGSLVHEKSLNLGCWTTNASLDRVDNFEDAMRKDYPEAKARYYTMPYLDPLIEYTRGTKCAVFVLGQHPIMDGENSNVTSMELSADQKAMIESVARYRVPMIAIIRAGRPLALESIEHYFDAIIYGWHNGTQGSHSLVAALFGDLNPSGRTPITFPRVTGQEPIYYNQTSSCRDNEGYYPGNGIGNYRNSIDTPMYPFGYGLSYTTFEYSEPTVKCAEISYDDIMNGAAFEVSVKVKNTGEREGRETVQLYVHDCVAKLTRPIRELKGFDKQTYAPGEEKTIVFRLTKNELGFWDDNKTYVVEPGKFKVWVGADCYAKGETEIRIK